MEIHEAHAIDMYMNRRFYIHERMILEVYGNYRIILAQSLPKTTNLLLERQDSP